MFDPALKAMMVINKLIKKRSFYEKGTELSS